MRLSRNEIDKEIQETAMSNNSDPTNFSVRAASAAKELAEFHRLHPDGWATTPRRGIQAERSIRHEEIRRDKAFASEQEKDAYLSKLGS